MRFIVLTVILAATAHGADPLSGSNTNRTPQGKGNWIGIAGVNGGIPTGQTEHTNYSPGASMASIQAGINSCPSNKFVLLAAGDYNAGNTSLYVEDNGAVVRGTWTTNSHTRFTNCPGSLAFSISAQGTSLPDWYNEGGESQSAVEGTKHTNWTGPYIQGTTTITLVNASGYSAGQMIWLDQLTTTNDSLFGNAQGGAYADDEYTSVAFITDGRDRCYKEGHRIVSVNGNDITLDTGIYLPDWQSGQDPEAWRFTAQPIVMAGVENIEFDGQIQIHLAYNCWVSNCIASTADINAQGAIRTFWSGRCTIEHCGVTTPSTGIDTYGIQTRSSWASLVQNNWSDRVGSGLMPSGSVAGVWAYNTITNLASGSGVTAMGLLQHGGNPQMNLYEGNFVPVVGLDNTWGSSSYNTVLRNRAIGFGTNTSGAFTGNAEAVMCSATNRYQSIIGNVLGTTGRTTWYEDYVGDGVACHDDPGRVYALGFWDVGCQEGPGPLDSFLRSSIIRAYNWDSATSTNAGIVTGGYVSSDIPSSYYLTNKPSWFGNLPWPTVDPGNTNQAMAYTNFPAGYREAFDVDPPPDSGLTFTQAPAGTAGITGGGL